MVEDSENLYLDWTFAKEMYTLIYKKSKDLCVQIKNGRYIDTKYLKPEETELFKEAMEIAINYHHDREDVLTH